MKPFQYGVSAHCALSGIVRFRCPCILVLIYESFVWMFSRLSEGAVASSAVFLYGSTCQGVVITRSYGSSPALKETAHSPPVLVLVLKRLLPRQVHTQVLLCSELWLCSAGFRADRVMECGR